jgi:hypothetical protein
MEKKIMDTKTLNDVLNLYHVYQALYVGGPIVGMGSDYVQLENKDLADLIPGRIVTASNRHDNYYPVQLSIMVDGVKFLALFTIQDIVSLRLVSYLPEGLEPDLEDYLIHLDPDDPVYRAINRAPVKQDVIDFAVAQSMDAIKGLRTVSRQAMEDDPLDPRD